MSAADDCIPGTWAGAHERRLLNDLMAQYNKLERPVPNETQAIVLKFGLTLQQIMDVVSLRRFITKLMLGLLFIQFT